MPLGLFPGVDLTRPVTRRVDRRAGRAAAGRAADADRAADRLDARACERKLAELGYLDPSEVDGRESQATFNAVMAFQKWEGLGRDGDVGPQTTAALAKATRPTPRTKGPAGARVEVLLDRQLTLFIVDNKVVRVAARGVGQARLRDADRLVPDRAQVHEGLVGAVRGVAAVGELLRRRRRVPRVPRRAAVGGVARLRAHSARRHEVALRPHPGRHARDRAGRRRESAALAVLVAALALAGAASAAAPPTKVPGELTVALSLPSPGPPGRLGAGDEGRVREGARARAGTRARGAARREDGALRQRAAVLAARREGAEAVGLRDRRDHDHRRRGSANVGFTAPYMAADQGVLAPQGPRARCRPRSPRSRSSSSAASARRRAPRTSSRRSARRRSRSSRRRRPRSSTCCAPAAATPRSTTRRSSVPSSGGARPLRRVRRRHRHGERYGIAVEKGSRLLGPLNGALNALIDGRHRRAALAQVARDRPREAARAPLTRLSYGRATG